MKTGPSPDRVGLVVFSQFATILGDPACGIGGVAQSVGGAGATVCAAADDGTETASSVDPCADKAAGEACSIHGGATGACGGDPLACVDSTVCDATTGATDNAHCATDTTPAPAPDPVPADDTPAPAPEETTPTPAPDPTPAPAPVDDSSGASAVAPAAALLLALALY